MLAVPPEEWVRWGRLLLASSVLAARGRRAPNENVIPADRAVDAVEEDPRAYPSSGLMPSDREHDALELDLAQPDRTAALSRMASR